jgi:enamine deaminase RidA (YjgF/YER057c/UK114 family)
MSVNANLKAKQIELPEASTPVANYVPYVVEGNLVYISGQLPLGVGDLKQFVGKVGKEFNTEQGKAIARICGLNIIAQLQNACGGDLDKVKRCVKLGVFVNCTEDFIEHPQVANGASDLMVEVFGEKGKHARFAVGSSQIPRGAAVEVDAVFSIA